MTQRGRPYLLVFVVGILAIGFFSYRSYEAQKLVLESGLSGEIRSIADVKASLVGAWREERLADARVLIADAQLMPAVQATLSGSASTETRTAVEKWADIVRSSYRYSSLALVDTSGQVRLFSGGLIGPSSFYDALTKETLSANGLVFRDAADGAHSRAPQFVLSAAIALESGQVLGAIVLGVDPWSVLYPVTLQWPQPSDSGEIVLARRDGADALYLLDARRHSGSALTARQPLTNDSSPIVKAVLGSNEFSEGVDDTGTSVFSAASPVAGTAWFVVAKIDEAEAHRPLVLSALVVALVAGALMVTLGAGLLLIWRYQVLTFRERLALALEAANEGLWEWDADQHTTHVSQRYCEMLGYRAGDLRPGHDAIRAMTHPDDIPALDRAFSGLADRDSYSLESRVRKKSGEYIWVLGHGKVIGRAEKGAPSRIVGSHIDITERRTLEDQLRQSQKLESIGRLAGGVAHDFNNLLTVINGYSDLLVSSLTDHDGMKGLAHEIRKAGDRAAGLTRQLLAFSRKQVTQPRLISLNALVADSEQMLRRLIGDDIEFLIHNVAEHDRVTADPGQLHQVLVNLVVNARDAMPRGGRLSIETSFIDRLPSDLRSAGEMPDGACVVLSVTDTGSGMDAATQARIFEPFFTTKGPGKGTGLGLPTVYGIVKQSGGVIQVTSAPGQGTSMRVYLPRRDAPLSPEMQRAQHPWSLEGSETVLVVEDRNDVRNFVARVLQTYGYRVIEAASGEDALQISESQHDSIDLLITDVVMPGINGKELADRLRVTRPGMTVVFMSGYSDEVLGERGELDADVAYLEKPFGPEELAAQVRTALNRVAVPRRILVVDDDAAIRSWFQQLLTPLGCDVLLAADGEEAVEMVDYDGELDLVITDLVMPMADDIETIAAIRGRRPQIGVIVMSGSFGEQFEEMTAQLGADAILTKPIEPHELYAVMGNLIADRRSRSTGHVRATN